MKAKRLSVLGLLLASLFILLPFATVQTFAQNTVLQGGGSSNQTALPGATDKQGSENLQLQIKLKNPLKVNTIQDAIKLFMDAVVKIAIPFIVVFFIWSGLQFILAQGNTEKLGRAKKTFWYTVIGTLLILGAWVITDAIVGTINSLAS